jgi:hypothetical protein
MFGKGCPRADELDALATGRAASKRVSQHVDSCETCAQIVGSLRRDASLAAELREARRGALDEETHDHVLNLCRQAARPAKN